jgi:hypothetical protein
MINGKISMLKTGLFVDMNVKVQTFFFGRMPPDFTLTSAKINSKEMNIGKIFTNSLFDLYLRRASVIGRGLFDCKMARSVGKKDIIQNKYKNTIMIFSRCF